MPRQCRIRIGQAISHFYDEDGNIVVAPPETPLEEIKIPEIPKEIQEEGGWYVWPEENQ